MLTSRNLMFACLLGLMFGACSEEKNEIQESETEKENTYPVRISTRASDVEINKIGLFMVYGEMKGSDNYIDNIYLTNNGSGNWTPERNIYWKDNNTTAEFVGYAPYNASINNALAYTFSVNPDQSTAQTLESNDFLWGKASAQKPTDSSIDITLNHIFSRVIVKVAAGDGFTESELKNGNLSVQLNGFRTKTVINLADGSLSNTSEVSVINTCQMADLQFDAIVIPQTVDNTGIVTVSFNGNDYTLTRSLSVMAGKRYTLTVTLSKTQGGINVGIGDWVDDGEDYGGTVK